VSGEGGGAKVLEDGAEEERVRGLGRQSRVRGFYSAVEETVDKIPFRRGNPEQAIGQLKNTAGVKQEELEWLGLVDGDGKPLNPFGKDRITKEELRDWVTARGPVVEERMLRGMEVLNQEGSDVAQERDAYERRRYTDAFVNEQLARVWNEQETDDGKLRMVNDEGEFLKNSEGNVIEVPVWSQNEFRIQVEQALRARAEAATREQLWERL